MLLLAQTADRQVICSAGGFSTATGLQVSNTTGEFITATGTSSSIILTQGFQQSSSDMVGIEELDLGFAIKAYPNPTSDAVMLDFTAEKNMQINIGLFDVQGKQVMPIKQLNLYGNMLHSLDMNGFNAGNYFVRLTNQDGKLNKSIQIQKVD
jgi:hypothetical protein